MRFSVIKQVVVISIISALVVAYVLGKNIPLTQTASYEPFLYIGKYGSDIYKRRILLPASTTGKYSIGISSFNEGFSAESCVCLLKHISVSVYVNNRFISKKSNGRPLRCLYSDNYLSYKSILLIETDEIASNIGDVVEIEIDGAEFNLNKKCGLKGSLFYVAPSNIK